MARVSWRKRVMKKAASLLTLPSSDLVAVVRTPCRSDPATGSVMAIAKIFLPAFISGRYFIFCSSKRARDERGGQQQ